MAFYCPKCEPDRTPSYGWSPAVCERHGQPDDAGAVDAPADTPASRLARFTAAMAAGDAAAAYRIAREPMSGPDWPEDERRPWGSRRDLARMALEAGSAS